MTLQCSLLTFPSQLRSGKQQTNRIFHVIATRGDSSRAWEGVGSGGAVERRTWNGEESSRIVEKSMVDLGRSGGSSEAQDHRRIGECSDCILWSKT